MCWRYMDASGHGLSPAQINDAVGKYNRHRSLPLTVIQEFLAGPSSEQAVL